MNIKKTAKYKIPKYILKLLDRRAAAAKTFMATTTKIDEWLERCGIPLTYEVKDVGILEDYTNTGAISLCEPDTAKEGFIKIVEAFFKSVKHTRLDE